MKKDLIKTICAAGLIVVMSVVVVVGVVMNGYSDNYVYKESDFSLEISVDKTDVVVGETVTVTVTFKNLSGRDICVKMPTTLEKKLRDLIEIYALPESVEWEQNFVYAAVGGPRKKVTLKKNAIIQKTRDFDIPSSDPILAEKFKKIESHYIAARIGFYVGTDYKTFVGIWSETIKVAV